MKRKSSKPGLYTGLTVASLSALLSLAFAQADSQAPQTPSIAQQIKSDIAQSLARIENSQSLLDWQTSGYTAEDVVESALALATPAATQALCDGLLELEPSQLTHFDDALFGHTENAEVTQLPCLSAIKTRMNSHWASLERQVRVELQSRQQFKSGPLSFESTEKPLSVRGGANLVSGDLADNEICLTFDDGPHPTRTARLLDILRSSGIRANFFQVGANARAFPQVSLRGAQEGHVMGSHSHSHKHLPSAGLRRAQEEILRGMQEVEEASGMATHFFRFPYGARNESLVGFLGQQNVASFLWNMDSLDWKIRNPARLLANVKRELTSQKGGIILFHDIHENTILTVPLVLQELHDRGYKTVVFVPENL